MSLAAAALAASLLASEPVKAPAVGRDVSRILAQDRYLFCAKDNDYVPWPNDRNWCEVAAAHGYQRCTGYAEVCAHEFDEGEFPWDSDGGGRSGSGEGDDAQGNKTPGKANRGAYEETEQIELPNLGGFAKVLMWALILGGLIALVLAIAKNLVRDNDDDEGTEPEPDLDPGESLVAARAAAMRVVETDVKRLLARAEQAAGRGDYEAAINDVHAAMLRRLEGEQLISVEHWKTNGDYIGELRAKPALRDEVRDIVREVEQVQFGAAPAEQGRYFNVRTKVVALVSRATLAFTILFAGATMLGCPLFETDPDALPNSAALAGLGTGPEDQRAVGELLLVYDIEAKHRTRSIEELTGTSGAIVLLEDVELVDEDWDTLLSWVQDQGGTLIIATGKEFPRRLNVDYGVFEPGHALAVEFDQYLFSQLELDLAAPGGRVFESGVGLTEELLARPISADEQQQPPDPWGFDSNREPETKAYAVSRRFGEGEVIMFAEPDLWTNVGISVADNAAFLINLLRSREITELEFVDQYTGAGPDDPFESMGNAKLGGLFLQILLFLALIYAAVGIPFARLREPQREARRSFVEHVRTLGQRYAQARAARYVAGLYSAWALDRLREWLLARTGGLLPLAQAIAARTGRDETQVMQLLIAAHSLREPGEHTGRGGAEDLELMRKLAQLLDECGGAGR